MVVAAYQSIASSGFRVAIHPVQSMAQMIAKASRVSNARKISGLLKIFPSCAIVQYSKRAGR